MVENQSSIGFGRTQDKWLPVVGYEGFYEVSNAGRVRSVLRVVKHSAHGAARHYGCIRKQSLTRFGYYSIVLCRNGTRKSVFVHRLVVEAFIGGIKPGYEVNHKNCRKTDNRVKNLEIVTRTENMRHAHAAGLIDRRGQKHSQAILNNNKVRKIRRLHPEFSYKQLSTMFGVSRGCISDVVIRKTWCHI